MPASKKIRQVQALQKLGRQNSNPRRRLTYGSPFISPPYMWWHSPSFGVGKNPLMFAKETTLERADFTLQLSMFVTAEKEGKIFMIFFLSIFCQLFS